MHRIDLGGTSLPARIVPPLAGTPRASPTVGDVRAVVVRAARISLLHGRPGTAPVYRHGQNSWSPTGWRSLADAPIRIASAQRRNTADDTVWDDPARHHASAVMAVGEVESTLLVGALGLGVPRLHADLDVLTAWTESGAAIEWFVALGPRTDVFRAYARAAADAMGHRDVASQKVWSSWYSLYEGVSEAALLPELPDIADLGFDTVQLDDGWERRVGDWRSNPKFPRGMQAFATSVRDSGLRPGLWLAPFITLPGTPLHRDHPEMLLRDRAGDLVVAGSNWGADYFTLDITRADARDLVGEIVQQVVEEWGFSYLKLDFINAAAVDGVRAEDVDRDEAFRTALQVVRAAAGESTFLLGSGSLFIPALGVLDAVRTGPDVAPMWTNYATDDMSDATAANSAYNAVHRLWWGEVIGIDPDAVYFRRRRNLLDDQQMGWLRDIATLCRFRAVSDPPSWLDEDEKEELRSWLSAPDGGEQVGPHTYRIATRTTDLSAASAEAHGAYPL